MLRDARHGLKPGTMGSGDLLYLKFFQTGDDLVNPLFVRQQIGTLALSW